MLPRFVLAMVGVLLSGQHLRRRGSGLTTSAGPDLLNFDIERRSREPGRWRVSTVASTITQQSNTRIRNCKFSSSLTAGPTAGGTGDSSRLCYQDLPRDPCGGVKV